MSRPRPGARLHEAQRETPAPEDAVLPEFRERVAEALAAFADALPAEEEPPPSGEREAGPAGPRAPGELEASAEALYAAWVDLSLALAHAALLDDRGSALLAPIAACAPSAPPEQTWRALLALARRLHVDLTRAPELDRLEPYAQPRAIEQLLGWLGELPARARRGEDGVVRELGGLHEVLLGLGFERLAAPARRLRKTRLWLSPTRVLREPPALRAKRLQRELGLSKHAVHTFGTALAAARTVEQVEASLSRLFEPDEPPRGAGRVVLRESERRRHSGAHYTPRPLCVELAERTLGPLLERLPEPKSAGILALRVCDPALGAGAFAIAAADHLSRALASAWRAEGAAAEDEALLVEARRRITGTVVCGVDKNPAAVALARLSLALFASQPLSAAAGRLAAGDALTGGLGAAPGAPRLAGLDWAAAFPDVFERANPGFDAVLGNPPWVAYVGRAAQPLEPALAAHYAATNPAFKRYRTLHGLFVYRSATLLREGGRLGLVLPTSVADLDGYSPVRAAHDALCSVDPALPDWGDGAFEGVFQPCMALLSTRRTGHAAAPRATTLWPLRDDGLAPLERGLLERLGRLERLPRELFGERGFQTTEDDQAHLWRGEARDAPGRVPLREGADVGEFRALPPQLFGDPRRLGARLRPRSDWREVKLLIRQTARFPMAALSDGEAFRNSILAGFASVAFPAPLLLCLLNSSLLRWLHFTRQRDARQGMPQLKVSHLRALPAPPANAPALAAIEALGQRLGGANAGVTSEARAELDRLVADAYALSGAERAAIAAWAELHPPPISRRQRSLRAGPDRPVSRLASSGGASGSHASRP